MHMPEAATQLCPDAILEETSRRNGAHKPATKETIMPAAPLKVVTSSTPVGSGGAASMGAAAPAVEAKKGAKLTNKQLFAAAGMWTLHGKIDGNIYTYAEGWDDARVHRELETAASIDSVIKARRDNVGKLASEMQRKGPRAGSVADLEARIVALEATVTRLVKEFGI